MKCHGSVENAHLNFSDKAFSFIIINDTEKQQILIFKRLNQQMLFTFFIGKKTKTINR